MIFTHHAHDTRKFREIWGSCWSFLTLFLEEANLSHGDRGLWPQCKCGSTVSPCMDRAYYPRVLSSLELPCTCVQSVKEPLKKNKTEQNITKLVSGAALLAKLLKLLVARCCENYRIMSRRDMWGVAGSPLPVCSHGKRVCRIERVTACVLDEGVGDQTSTCKTAGCCCCWQEVPV